MDICQMKKAPLKQLVYLLFLLILFQACNETNSTKTMMVNGNVKGLKKGILYLQHVPDTSLYTIDSIEIKGDGAFSFETEIESPEIFYLYLNKEDNNDINDRITFFGEPGTITITTNWNTFDSKAIVEGSKSHIKYEEYKDVMSKFNKQNMEILQGTYDPKIQKDSLAMDSIQQESDKNLVRSYLYALNFAINNKDSYVAPYIAITEVPDAQLVYLDSIYNSLTPEVADSKYGLALKEHLSQVRETEAN